MSYINVGARINGRNAATKKALREAMATEPQNVIFYPTSLFDGLVPDMTGDDLPAGRKLTVVGPDPYTSRKWYATVTDKGKVT